MVFCSLSSRLTSAGTSRLPRGPAATAFLRGLPGDLAGPARVTGGFGIRRLGSAAVGLAGLRAMGTLLRRTIATL